MARSQLTETIERVQGMVAYVRENLNPGEYDLFLDLVAPEPQVETKTTKKKSNKKRGPKSPRASSLQQQIQSTRTTTSKPALCTYELNGKICHGAEEDGVHDPLMGYTGHHEFQPAQQAASASGGD